MAIEVAIDGNTTNLDAKLAAVRQRIQSTSERSASAASAAGSALGAISGEMGALGGAAGAVGGVISQLAAGPVGLLTAAITLAVTVGIALWQAFTQSAEEHGKILENVAARYDRLAQKMEKGQANSAKYMERISAIDAKGAAATKEEIKEREKLLHLIRRQSGVTQKKGESRESYFERVEAANFSSAKKMAYRKYEIAKKQKDLAIYNAAQELEMGYGEDYMEARLKTFSPERLLHFAQEKMVTATTQDDIEALNKLILAVEKLQERKAEIDSLNEFGTKTPEEYADGLQKESATAQKAQQDAATKAKATADATAGRDAAKEALKDAEAAAKGGDDLERRTLEKLAKLRAEIAQKEQEVTRKTGDERLKAEKEVFDLKRQEITLEQAAKNFAAQKAQKQASEQAAQTAARQARDTAQKSLDEARARQAGGQTWQNYLEREKRETDAQIQREQRRIQTLSGTDRLKAEKNLIDLQRKSLTLGQNINAAASAQQQKWALPDYITNDLTRRGGGIGLAAASNNVVDINKNILSQQRASVSVQNAILNAVQNIGVTVP